MPCDPRPLLARVADGRDLDAEEAEALLSALLDGDLEPGAAGALLMGLRAKGEAEAEIVGFARGLRRRAAPFPAADPDAVDTCGTGGDGASTMNLSTAAAIAAAAAGVRVLKHGNRAVSSRSGSADVLAALGIDPAAEPARWAAAYAACGLAFLLAPRYHPAMKAAAPIRQALGFRTIFNLVGPLANPAGVRRQVVGVASAPLLPRVAGALGALGCERAIVLHGAGGLDEASPIGPTRLLLVDGGAAPREETLDPQALGIPPCGAAVLRVADAAEGAKAIEAVLAGERGPRREAVALNAALALLVAPSPPPSLQAALERARAAIDGGAARALLATLRRLVPAPRIG